MSAESIRLECLRLATMALPPKATTDQVLARAMAYLEFVRPARPARPPRKSRA
jgi:hypothetical protein